LLSRDLRLSVTIFLTIMSQPNLSNTEAFYKLAKDRDIQATYNLSMEEGKSRWFLIKIYRGADQHTFAHLSLLKSEALYGRVQYVLWHFNSQHSKGVGVSLVEYEPSNKDINPTKVRDC
jgi:hypothetical protein